MEEELDYEETMDQMDVVQGQIQITKNRITGFSTNVRESMNCSICKGKFYNIRRHVLMEHLPLHTAPLTASWNCKLRFDQRGALSLHCDNIHNGNSLYESSLLASGTDNGASEKMEEVFDNVILTAGECGLDVKTGKKLLDKQVWLFRKQLVLAKEKSLPVVIHCRGVGVFQCCLDSMSEVLPTNHRIPWLSSVVAMRIISPSEGVSPIPSLGFHRLS